MLFKTKDGKMVEILRATYPEDKAYYLAIMRLKGYLSSSLN